MIRPPDKEIAELRAECDRLQRELERVQRAAVELRGERERAAKKCLAAVSDLERWQNCLICIECGRGKADEDGCCVTCGRDCLGFVDGKLVNTGVADHVDGVDKARRKAETERDAYRAVFEAACSVRDDFDDSELPTMTTSIRYLCVAVDTARKVTP